MVALASLMNKFHVGQQVILCASAYSKSAYSKSDVRKMNGEVATIIAVRRYIHFGTTHYRISASNSVNLKFRYFPEHMLKGILTKKLELLE
ncbi:MAG: hypothetical protein HQ541_04375 [Mariniphaga sp.]|nr:hypothetical protein [Mariniphaga sp.]